MLSGAYRLKAELDYTDKDWWCEAVQPFVDLKEVLGAMSTQAKVTHADKILGRLELQRRRWGDHGVSGAWIRLYRRARKGL